MLAMRYTHTSPTFSKFRWITSRIARSCSAHSVRFATGSGCQLEVSTAMSMCTFFMPA